MPSRERSKNPVLVTDLGLVAASGVGVEQAWRCVEQGRTCIGPVRSFDASAFDGALGAELLELPRDIGAEPEEERAVHLLLGAASDLRSGLVEHLERAGSGARRTAVVLGTSKGLVLKMAPIHRKIGRGEAASSEAELRAIEEYRPGHGASRLAEHLGARGPRSTLALACASSSMAIIQAAEMIRRGLVDRAVAGGFDAFSPFIFSGFHSIGALSKTACRPFDRRRDGTVLGEAAALLVLESPAAAAERGVEPLARYVGGGYAADGVHLTAPDREGRGLARAIDQALVDAGLEPGQLDYINAHGTGTRFNDAMECQALARVFGASSPEEARVPPISSSKSIFGHTLGAAGALDAILCVLALGRQVLPPTVGGVEEPEVLGWDFIRDPGRVLPSIGCTLSTNSGFGGNNTALIFRRVDGEGGGDREGP